MKDAQGMEWDRACTAAFCQGSKEDRGLHAWTAVVLELDVGAGWCTTMGVMSRKDLNPTWYRIA